MPEGKKVRIRVRTVNCVYIGDFLIPPMRNRVSDAINEEQRLFISLTDREQGRCPLGLHPRTASGRSMSN